MTIKKILITIMAIAIVVSVIPSFSFADSKIPTDTWGNHAATEFDGGIGTKNDPYLIATAEQLAKLAADVNNGNMYLNTYFKLENNLNLSIYRWNPIGTYKWETGGTTINSPFGGNLDGNGKSISGLYVDERTDGNNAGLFGYISTGTKTPSENMTIKNLTVTDAAIYSSEAGLKQANSGILAGAAMVNDGQRITIENVTVSGTITNEKTTGNYFSGGMIGSANRVDFTNCKADGVIIQGGTNIGGFIGGAMNCDIEGCQAKGSITGGWSLGGFVGYMTTSTVNDVSTASTIAKCVADVDVEGNDWRAGGFAGYIEYGKIENSVGYGDVTSTVTGWKPKAGGFVGENSGTINNSYALGIVMCSHSSIQGGGFVGFDHNGITAGCMFDKTINLSLSAIGESDSEGTNDINDEVSQQDLKKVCTDVLGQHNYSTEWTTDAEPTYTNEGSKSHHCTRCGEKTDITSIPKLTSTVVTTYSVTASAGQGGKISNLGNTSAYPGQNITYTITPDSGYEIADVIVDGISVGAVTTYTFKTVAKNHTITVTFKKIAAEKGAKIITGVQNTTIMLSATSKKTGIQLSWKKSKGYKVDKYKIYRKTGNGKYVLYKTTTKTTFLNTKVKQDTNYRYKVSAERTIAGKIIKTKTSNIIKIKAK